MKSQKKNVWNRTEESEKVKRYICQSKMTVKEQFGKKMNEDVNGNGL